jgi:hypothetical protein
VTLLSRRAMLGASAGLVGSAAIAPTAALAQAPVQEPVVQPVPAGPPFVIVAQAPVRPDWLAQHTEPILEPDLPIIDPHHHLWDRPSYRYLMPELLADVGRPQHSRDDVRADALDVPRRCAGS